MPIKFFVNMSSQKHSSPWIVYVITAKHETSLILCYLNLWVLKTSVSTKMNIMHSINQSPRICYYLQALVIYTHTHTPAWWIVLNKLWKPTLSSAWHIFIPSHCISSCSTTWNCIHIKIQFMCKNCMIKGLTDVHPSAFI